MKSSFSETLEHALPPSEARETHKHPKEEPGSCDRLFEALRILGIGMM